MHTSIHVASSRGISESDIEAGSLLLRIADEIILRDQVALPSAPLPILVDSPADVTRRLEVGAGREDGEQANNHVEPEVRAATASSAPRVDRRMQSTEDERHGHHDAVEHVRSGRSAGRRRIDALQRHARQTPDEPPCRAIRVDVDDRQAPEHERADADVDERRERQRRQYAGASMSPTPSTHRILNAG